MNYLNILDSLKENLKENKIEPRFLVLGSHALKEAGIPLRTEPQDIDLALGIKGEGLKTLEKMLSLLESSYQKKLRDYPEVTKNQFKISWKGITIDIWIYNEEDFENLLKECKPFYKYNYMFANVKSILEAKAKYHREKDLEDIVGILNGLSKLFLPPDITHIY